VPAIPEGGTIPRSHYFAFRNNHGPPEAESYEELAKTEGQTPAEEFSGAGTYYGRFISAFADIAKQMTRLT